MVANGMMYGRNGMWCRYWIARLPGSVGLGRMNRPGGGWTNRLTRELEKKFSDRHVVFVAQRRMLRKPTRTSRVQQKRPRSRTLTNVHEKILEDLVFPTEIVGKRTRVAVDGSKLLKVYVFIFDFSPYYLYRSVQPVPHNYSMLSSPHS